MGRKQSKIFLFFGEAEQKEMNKQVVPKQHVADGLTNKSSRQTANV